MKKIVLFISLLLGCACGSDDTEIIIVDNTNNNSGDPVALTVTVNSVTDDGANISWVASNDNGQNVLYKIVLDNEVIIEGFSGSQYTFSNLEEQTTYSGVLFYNGQDGTQTFQEFSFTTLLDTTLIGSYLIDTQEKADNFFYTSISLNLRIRGQEIVDLSNLASLIEVGNIIIEETSLQSLEGLQNVRTWSEASTATGAIYLSDNLLLNDVTALSNLDPAGAVQIVGCTGLRNLNGISMSETWSDLSPIIRIVESGVESISVFSNVVSLHSLELESLPNLTGIVGLDNLERVTNTLNFSNLPLISDVTPLHNFQEADAFQLIDLENLQSVSGLDNLFHINAFHLEDLPQLSAISGFSMPSVISLKLENLSSLSDLSAFSSLNQVKIIRINNNLLLTHLNDFSNLTSSTDGPVRIYIQNNTNLSDFCGLTEYMQNTVVEIDFNSSGDPPFYYVSGNAYNPTEVQVESTTECSL